MGTPNGSYYGMQIPQIIDGVSWPQVTSITAVRLWDNYVTWRDINPSPHVFDFSRLDACVANAEAHGATILLVLGQTPEWCSSDLSQSTPIGTGAGAYPTDHAYWVEYVQAVATRYAGRIDAYEIWNEADSGYSCMTAAQMAYLSSLACRTINGIDPAAKITSPSWVERGPNTFMNDFIDAGGYGGTASGTAWALDAHNVHGYPLPGNGPESAVNNLMNLKSSADARIGRSLPMWDTEINYNLPTGGTVPFVAQPLTEEQQGAFVSRTFIYGHAKGIKRHYWYAWQNGDFLGVKATDPNNALLPSQAIKAMATAKWWLRGDLTSLTYDATKDLYIVKISYSDSWSSTPATIKWCPSGTIYPGMPGGATLKYDMYGNSLPLNSTVGIAPVLYR